MSKPTPGEWAAIVATAMAVAGFLWRRIARGVRQIVSIVGLPARVNALDTRVSDEENRSAEGLRMLRAEVTERLNKHEQTAHAAIEGVKAEVRTLAVTVAKTDDLQRVEDKIDSLTKGLALRNTH